LPIFLVLFSISNAYTQENSFFFVENKGQWKEEILFGTDLPEGKLFIKKDGLSYQFTKIDTESDIDHHHGHSHGIRQESLSQVELSFKESNVFKVTTSKKHEEKYNYYLGSDQSRWSEGCNAYDELLFENVYEGIDLKIYGKGESIKYDWIVEKGANPAQIKIQYHDEAKIFLENGCAFVELESATIMENEPVSYQKDKDGNRIKITTSYTLKNNELSYVLSDDYDPNEELIIDPELVFSTFSGSTSDNFGYTACFDDDGNLYSGGIVFGSSFPSTTGETFGGGVSDIAILKYDSIGQDLLYATFIGGSGGESPHSLIVNNAGELVILGTTGSTDYPTSSAAYDDTYNGGDRFDIFETYREGSDIVLTKLDRNGQLIASTFIGGTGNDGVLKLNSIGNYVNELIYNYGDYQRGDITVDEADNIYIASSTESVDFPVNSSIQSVFSGGNSDAVIFSLDSDLSTLRWSSYLGGSRDDAVYSVKLNDLGQVAVGGGTTSSNFPLTTNAYDTIYGGDVDGIITVIDVENDTLVSSTFVGTSAYDQIYFIDIDSEQSVYAAGQTTGNYPISDGIYANPNSGQFIHKFNSKVDSTIFSTTIGTGTPVPNISPTAFLANECNNLFLSGWGGEVNTRNARNSVLDDTRGLPVTDDAFSPSTDGSDFYLLVLSDDGSELLYATYFGSTNNGGDHVDGGTSRFDKRGIVYQSVCSCGGSNDNFPTTENAWSEVNNGTSAGIGRCNNAAFKFDLATLRAGFQTSNTNGENIGVTSGCLPLSILFTNTGSGGEEFFWDFGNGTTSNNEDFVVVTYEETGDYVVSLTVRDENTCTSEDSFSTTISIFDDQVSISDDTEICEGASTQLLASGGTSYQWRPEIGLSNSSIANPIASPPATTIYEVDIVTPNGCEFTESLTVLVNTTITEVIDVEEIYSSCFSSNTFQFSNSTEYTGEMVWDFGDGQTSAELNPMHTYQAPGVYSVGLELDEICVVEQTLTVESTEIFIPNVITPNNDMLNHYFQIKTPVPVALTVVNRTGSVVFEKDNYNNEWDGDDLPPGIYYYSIRFPNNFTCKGWVQIIK